MPILDASYIASWFHIVDALTGDLRLVESHNEEQVVEVSRKKLIQGDLGMRVASVGGSYWKTTVSSPVIYLELDNLQTQQATTIFDIIIDYFQTFKNPALLSTVPAIMESADIKIADTEIACNATFLHDNPGLFVPIQGSVDSPYSDFFGRTAKWFDTQLYVSTALGGAVQILNGSIKIKGDIQRVYIQGGGQTPYFAIQGYEIDGDLTVLVSPNNFDALLIPDQQPGQFISQGYATTGIGLANGPFLPIGEVSINSQLTRSIKAGDVTSIRLAFKTFARYDNTLNP